MKQQRKKEKNIFTETDKRYNRVHFVVSKLWPDGTRFRRRCPNLTLARNLLARINGTIVAGTWKELRKELTEPAVKEPVEEPKGMTIEGLATVYFSDYCQIHNTRPDFKEHALKPIRRILGDIEVRAFRRSHAYDFQKELREELEPATVNNYVAVLKNMFTFAVDEEIIDAHPLVHFRKLPVDERALRIMEPHEERRLVEAVFGRDPVIGAYAGILGETGLRKTEGLLLKWHFVNLDSGMLTVETSKNRRVRHIPLSDFAIELFKTVPRTPGIPYCFVRPETMDRWKDPDGPLEGAVEALGWEGWIRGWHDFRHYRATQWIIDGMDVVTVKNLMGHRDLTTTQRYVHYVSEHAKGAVRQAEQRELARLKTAQEKQATNRQRATVAGVVIEPKTAANSLCRKEDSNLHALAGTRT